MVTIQRAADVGQLLRKVAGHLGAIRFVSVILNFLKCLRLEIKAANAGDGFSLLVAERWSGNIEYGRKVFRREIVTQLAQHIYENVGCSCRYTGLCGHAPLPSHGVIGAEDKGHRVDQEYPVLVIGYDFGPLRRRCGRHRYGFRRRLYFFRQCFSRRQPISLAVRTGVEGILIEAES